MQASRKITVKFKPCCKQSLEAIGDIEEVGSLLRPVLAVSPFIPMVGANPIDIAVSLITPIVIEKLHFERKVDEFVESINSVDVIVRRRCKDIAGLERLRHQRDPNLRFFWTKLYNAL